MSNDQHEKAMMDPTPEQQRTVDEFKRELEVNHQEIADRRRHLIETTGHALPKSRREWLHKAAMESLRERHASARGIPGWGKISNLFTRKERKATS